MSWAAIFFVRDDRSLGDKVEGFIDFSTQNSQFWGDFLADRESKVGGDKREQPALTCHCQKRPLSGNCTRLR